MARKYRLGSEFYLYRNTASHASPTWVELDRVGDVTPNYTKGEAETTTRASARTGWMTKAPLLKEAEIQFNLQYDPADATFVALRNAFNAPPTAPTPIEFLILDGPRTEAGHIGFRLTMDVFNFSDPQPVNGVVVVSVTIKPIEADNPPEVYDTGT